MLHEFFEEEGLKVKQNTNVGVWCPEIRERGWNTRGGGLIKSYGVEQTYT